jgi:hypothetical protein
MGARRPRQVVLVLDAGALIGIERNDERMLALLDAAPPGTRFLVPAGALVQAWRDGARQAFLARFLRSAGVEVLPLSEAHARAAGVLCGLSRTSDVVDASVVVSAREHRCPVVTGDPGDLGVLDPALQLHRL